jgi:two-component system, OmpR family, alkaline phosphatase synthesis response regulator PhoP
VSTADHIASGYAQPPREAAPAAASTDARPATPPTILVVDDEKDIRDLLSYNLNKHGYKVVEVGTGEDALREARLAPPDLVVLDLMLPGVDGLEVCKRLKNDKKTSRIPVLMLSARGEEADVVVGLELGADDYITKPFSPRVLLAHIKAVLRRGEQGTDERRDTTVAIGPIVINTQRHELLVGGQPVELTALEMRILTLLAKVPGRVFTRTQIVEQTQGAGVGVTDRSVDVHIVSLRRKLGEAATLIETVRGVGYRFAEIED